MSGELERCLAAGMDALLTKPLEVARLREVLVRYLTPATSESVGGLDVTSACGAGKRPGAPIDLTRLRALIGEDDSFVRELCETYIGATEESLRTLERALGSRRSHGPRRLRSQAERRKSEHLRGTGRPPRLRPGARRADAAHAGITGAAR